MTGKPRSSRRTDNEDRGAYRALREQFRTRCMAARTPCHFCGNPIDWSLRHPDPGSFEVHHTQAVALYPQYELETSLWACSHKICNSLNQAAYDVDGHGPEESVLDTGLPSESWMEL